MFTRNGVCAARFEVFIYTRRAPEFQGLFMGTAHHYPVWATSKADKAGTKQERYFEPRDYLQITKILNL
jgi:hypothetical protein